MGWKGPSSNQTAPNKDKSPVVSQLMQTQGMCISSTHCQTLVPCFGYNCPYAMLLYTRSHFTQLAAFHCYCVLWDLATLKTCDWWALTLLYRVIYKSSMKSSVLPPSMFQFSKHVLSLWYLVFELGQEWLRASWQHLGHDANQYLNNVK